MLRQGHVRKVVIYSVLAKKGTYMTEGTSREISCPAVFGGTYGEVVVPRDQVEEGGGWEFKSR
jgi:hypothetical protein